MAEQALNEQATDERALDDAARGEAAQDEAAQDEAARAVTGSLVYGFAFSQISGVFSRLGVPQAFDEPVKSLDELALATDTHRASLRRLLRAAAALGLLSVRPDGRFALTPTGRVFRDDPALRKLTSLYGDRAVWRAYGALEDAVRNGGSGFEHAHGIGLFDVLETDTQLADTFNSAMESVTAAQTPAIVEAYDFTGIGHLLDVGGGDGGLLAAILRSRPRMRGTLLDRPAALDAASSVLAAAGVADRCAVVEGDFFASLPPGADACLLKNILHNWEDADCVRVLRRCREALGPAGRVLVPALVLPEPTAGAGGASGGGQPEEAAMALSDVEMMVLTAGRERTMEEYRSLFERAGLRGSAAVPLPGLPSHFMLEAVPDPAAPHPAARSTGHGTTDTTDTTGVGDGETALRR